jgi:hypothetical protein
MDGWMASKMRKDIGWNETIGHSNKDHDGTPPTTHESNKT